MEKKPLIVLAGPTAVGKTKLSVSLAKAVNGEIISADSMQVYKKMNIGTAKITEQEMQGIPHHLIDVLSPEDEFNVVVFKRLVQEAMKQIYQRGKVPILTGGTGFYIQAVTNDISFLTNTGEGIYRKALETYAALRGAHSLHEILKRIDPVSAEMIHENNIKRTVRAIEFYYQTGQRISEHNEEQQSRETPYDLYYFVLNAPRDYLYRQIDRRVDRMMEEGLLQEVQSLKEDGYNRSLVSMQGLGYKEILAYLDGECTLEEAVSIIKRDTRHFAKRQLTWFKRENDVIWINKEQFAYEEQDILNYVLGCLTFLQNNKTENHQ